MALAPASPPDPVAPMLTGLTEVSDLLAHELRNPLAAIKGHAQLLAELLPLDDDRHERAERVVAEVGRLERLVDDLLELSSTAVAHRSLTSPASLAQAAAERAAGVVVVRCERAPAEWPLDAPKVAQALDRLLSCGLMCLSGRSGLELHVESSDGVLYFRILPNIKSDFRKIANIEKFELNQCPGLGMAVVRRAAALHRGDVLQVAAPDGGVALLLRS